MNTRRLKPACSPALTCVLAGSFSNLLGVDYVEASIDLSREVAAAAGFNGARFQARRTAQQRGSRHQRCAGTAARYHTRPRPQVDNVLESSLESGSADLVVDKGTLDAIGLSADGDAARKRYVAAVARLLPQDGLLVCV